MTGFNVGDKGQRYEVQCKNEEGETVIVGWGETDEHVANLVKGIELHPSYSTPKVIDRPIVKGRERYVS